MKKPYFLLAFALFFAIGEAQIIHFPDANFKAKLLEANPNNTIAYNAFGYRKIDTNNNGEIEADEASQINQLRLDNSEISSLEGITGFVNLYGLHCSNNQLTNLNLNGLNRLMSVDCSFNQITTLTYDSPEMMRVYAVYNQLTFLDVSSSSLGYDDMMGVLGVNNNPIVSIQALNTLPYLCDIDFPSVPTLNLLCCATQENIGWFQMIADLQQVTTVEINSSCLLNTGYLMNTNFNVYPNPVGNFLNIEIKSDIKMTAINIYNTLGQIVLVIPNAKKTKTIDVSSLKTGNYFMKINSDKGNSSIKFVKL